MPAPSYIYKYITTMKNHFRLFILLLLTLTVSAVSTPLQAKDKTDNAALITVTSYDRQGKVIRSDNGFYIDGQGEALSTYDVFKDAYRAKIKDSKGKVHNVTRISGANDLYNIVRFRTDAGSTACLKLAAAPISTGTQVSILSATKGAPSTSATISKVEDQDNIKYYTLGRKLANLYAGCPLANPQGEAVAIMQRNTDRDAQNSFALDIAFVRLLVPSGMTAAQIAINKIHIPKLLPDGEAQARTFICLMPQNSQDSVSYLTAIDDYIKAYPQQSIGYTQLAAYHASLGQYAKADADYEQALSQSNQRADVHYEKSKLIYRLNMIPSYQQYKDWNMDKSIAEAEAAYAESPIALFLLQKGDAQFAKKQYQEAYDTYQQVNQTNIASPQTFAAASVAAEMAGKDSTTILSLLDSAVNRFPKPYPKSAALYLLQRATHLHAYGQYAAAAADYQRVEDLQGTTKLNDNFYFQKYQCDTYAQYYPVALRDIEKALSYKPQDYSYLVEKALAEWRMGDYDEAIYAAQEAIKQNPNGHDAYKALGIAQAEKGDKTNALRNLAKAKELGDTQAQGLIDSLKGK